MKVLEHKKFRAAYDFLMLRAKVEGSNELIGRVSFGLRHRKRLIRSLAKGEPLRINAVGGLDHAKPKGSRSNE